MIVDILILIIYVNKFLRKPKGIVHGISIMGRLKLRVKCLRFVYNAKLVDFYTKNTLILAHCKIPKYPDSL